MADFYPLLDRAIRGLPDNTPEARNALFARARDVLLAQLRGMEPPVDDEVIAGELAALDEVIVRIEQEQAAATAGPTAPAAAAPGQPASAAKTSAAAGTAPGVASAAPASAGPGAAPATPTPAPATTLGATPASAAPRAPSSQLGHTAIRPSGAPSAAAPAPAGGPATTAAPLSARRPSAGAAAEAADMDRASASDGAGDDADPHLRPPAPAGDGKGKRNIIIGAVLAVALAGVAGVAYWANKVNAPAPQPQEATAPVSQEDATPEQKFTQRVEGPGAPQGGSQSVQAVAGAQRAILYEESPDNPQTPRVLTGTVKWRLDSENPGDNQPLENVVRADVDIPEAGLNLLITMRKNTDAALPASHLMELTFRRTAEGEGRVVRDVGVPQFKQEENARGVPLAGLPVAVSDAVFLVGLSNLPNDVERNIELIRSRPWIDLPVRYDNGRRAVIALEKGAEGEKVVNEALAAWAPQR